MDVLDDYLDDWAFVDQLDAAAGAREEVNAFEDVEVTEPRELAPEPPGGAAKRAARSSRQIAPDVLETAAYRASELRKAIGLPQRTPIHDVVAAMETAGCDVALEPLGLESEVAVYARRNPRGLALVNSSILEVRTPWVLAHQLGHHAMGHRGVVVDGRDVDRRLHVTRKSLRESEADAFAGHFLVPDAALWEQDGAALQLDIAALALDYHIGINAAYYRIGDLRRAGLAEPSIIASDVVGGSARLWQGLPVAARGGRRRPPRLLAAAMRAYQRYDISLGRLAEIMGVEARQLRVDMEWSGWLHQEDRPPPS